MKYFITIAVIVLYHQLSSGDGTLSIPHTDNVAQPLPAPWKQQYIGQSRKKWYVGFNGRLFSMLGSGPTVDGPADECQFTYFPMDSAGELTVRVTPRAGLQSARMGLMMRESLAANAAQVSLTLNATEKVAGVVEWRAVQFSRSEKGQPLQIKNAGELIDAPVITSGKLTGLYWLRLQRKFNSFYAFVSPDGKTWTAIGSTYAEMSSNFFAGMTVSPGSKDTAVSVMFDHVSIPGWSTE